MWCGKNDWVRSQRRRERSDRKSNMLDRLGPISQHVWCVLSTKKLAGWWKWCVDNQKARYISKCTDWSLQMHWNTDQSEQSVWWREKLYNKFISISLQVESLLQSFIQKTLYTHCVICEYILHVELTKLWTRNKTYEERGKIFSRSCSCRSVGWNATSRQFADAF